ncbi:oxepin-CoA hydrolase, alternative type [Jannaschia sp. W003]|uniref:oxepin-CoA hydrolase, alternative type n=1 Tax=Jannaschia sp. W003 TaxID=2867012 RepID=UPI0021A47A2B|nr:enoyl-CoA hydratase family protein [Jannaschia sp. W003]UWQ21529.1 enoyl-CoA hydratase/isomerase family protein [Jannaschia sp. W003]
MTARLDDLGDRLVVVGEGARRNALTPEYYAVLAEALRLAGEPRVAAVILHGEGGYFCAGGDLRLLATRRDLPRPERLDRIEALHDLVRGIMACPVPVIAALEGGAAGAGASIAFACDMVVAARGATVSAAYVKAGLVPDGGLTASLAATLPRPMLMRMALLGEAVAIERLHDLGAVSDLCEPGDALAAAHALADRLAAGPRAAQATIKDLVAAAYHTAPLAQMDRERDAMADAVAAPEAAEGIGAFLAKRVPDYRSLP